MKLSEKQIQQFWEDGFLIVDGLLDGNEVATIRQRVAWVASGGASHVVNDLLQVGTPRNRRKSTCRELCRFSTQDEPSGIS